MDERGEIRMVLLDETPNLIKKTWGQNEEIELFEIPQYSIKRGMMELDTTTGEPYMARWMREHREEALALELRENRLVCHVERVVSSLEQ